MSLELPALSAVIARLPNPDINLAAYGGVVFPLALIFESPIIMLLAASTALSKDYASYQRLHTYMMRAGLILTAVHILVAFTPLYYVVVVGIIGAPQEIVEPARLGLMIMTPWTWSIAYRRFNQGVLIRSGHSKAVGSRHSSPPERQPDRTDDRIYAWECTGDCGGDQRSGLRGDQRSHLCRSGRAPGVYSMSCGWSQW